MKPAHAAAAASSPVPPVRSERMLLWLLAGLQFTHILDFLIVSPLAPQFMRQWRITAQEFGYLVSVYAFSASVAGLGAAFVIDQFDRRSALMLMYAGFVVATLLCAFAPGYWTFFAARAMAGAFGGVIGSIVLAIVADVVPPERRGRAMGLLMSAFPIVSVIGVPSGLYLANHFGWHAPFFALGLLGCMLLGLVPMVVPPIISHVKEAGRHQRSRLEDFINLFTVSNHRRALGAIFVFTLSGFMIYPFLSAFHVKNVGITEAELIQVFLFSGIASLISTRVFGWCADRYGKRRMFYILACASIVPIVVATHMTRAPLILLLCVTVPFMVLMSGRFIPLMALITTCVHAPVRGAFMSLSSAVQNLGAGIASLFAGAVIGHTAEGALTRFDLVGIVAVVLTLLCLWLVRGLHPVVDPAQEALTMRQRPH